ARIISSSIESVLPVQIRFYLVVDPVLGITAQEVRRRSLSIFGTATIQGNLLNVAHFPWPREYRRGQIIINTDIVAWQGVRQSVYRGETFLTDDSHYQRRLTECHEEKFSGYRSTIITDVITFYPNHELPEPLIKLEHELGHALGIRHTESSQSVMYHEGGSSQSSHLTVSDVVDILWQLDPSIQNQWQVLSSGAIRRLHPRGTITPNSPVAN
ncbi:MAG: matrixin family metalloprotease, partial [Thermoanaerobaculia bacterium]|nr:matrixin family metalloprotease [Thermoanaerobaculia bacterium]